MGGYIMKKEEISLKNTKQEILDALNEALLREKNAAKMKSNPIEEEKSRKIESAVAETKKNVEQNIFSTELVNKFKDLEVAIKAEEEKLQNLYGVEKELNNLTLVINTGKDYLNELEVRKQNETARIEQELKKLEEELAQKTEDLTKEFEHKSETLKLERKREIEEYEYKVKREREHSNNAWEDEKQVREQNLKIKEEETKKLLDDAKAKSKYFEDLEKKVEEIPNLINKEYEKGKIEATAELEKEYKYNNELLKKDFQNIIDRQNDKIEALKEELEKVNILNSNLQEKMDKAYIELKELATKTVEANGGVKILGQNNQNENK